MLPNEPLKFFGIWLTATEVVAFLHTFLACADLFSVRFYTDQGVQPEPALTLLFIYPLNAIGG